MRRILPALGLAACTSAVPTGPLPGTGYVDVVLDLSARGIDPAGVTEVVVGGLRAYDLRPDGDMLVVTVQGGPPGPAPVVVRTDAREHELGAITYEAPLDPLFERFVAFGASLTQGTRDAVPTASAQLAGPAMQVARAAGAWLPLPILTDPLDPMTPGDVDDDCATPDTVAFIVNGLLDTLDRLVDPATGKADLSLARVTPEVEVHNVAVGNATLVYQRVGYDNRPEDVVAQMLGRITLEAEGSDLFLPLERNPLQRVIELEPTLVVSFDLWGNDAIFALFGGDGPAGMTPVEEVAAELDTQLGLLEATGAEVVLAALPDVTLLPGLALEPDEEAEVRDRVAAYNQVARDAAATRDWLHVAPTDRVVAEVADGLVVGDATLSTAPLGGLLSLDGLHFTDTGYALAANVVLALLRDELGVDVPDVDLEAVYATDTRTPEALIAAGVPERCVGGR